MLHNKPMGGSSTPDNQFIQTNSTQCKSVQKKPAPLKLLIFLTITAVILMALFLLIGLNSKNWQFALSLRIPKLMAIVLTGSAIAFSTTVFQTITNNRILTPSILGLDSLYIFIQTAVVFFFGSGALAVVNDEFNFLLAVGIMVVFAMGLFQVLFKKIGSNILFVLLVGIIVGTFFQSMASFMQMLIDPNEFLVIQGSMFASFNSINTEILGLAVFGVILTFGYTWRQFNNLDVMALGRENAINLGVDYDLNIKKMLVVIAIQVSIATALVGPITFLGLLVVNLAREILKTYKHLYLVLGSVLLSSIALVGGQLLAERIFHFSTPISVIINFIGGVYFIYLLLKEAKL